MDDSSDKELMESINAMVPKMQETLDYYRKVVSERTPFIIRQKRVILKKIDCTDSFGQRGIFEL